MTRNINLLNILIGIDDTDNSGSPGSGSIAEQLARELCSNGLAQCQGITRHQLYVHSDIPFTSHNSSMCIPAKIHGDRLGEIISFGQTFLQDNSAEGSDPGLCVVVDDPGLDRDALIHYGRQAKKSILDKTAAYDLAGGLGVHLSEHGGTGGGVIGALAAIGLRLSGNDGRYRGWHFPDNAGQPVCVADLCTQTAADAVVTEDGRQLAPADRVLLAADPVKTVLMNGLRVIPVIAADSGSNGPEWTTMAKKAMKRF